MNATSDRDPGRHRRLRDVVDRGLDLPSSGWPAFLDRECPSDADLRAEAEVLLKNARAAEAEGFLDPPRPSPGSDGPTFAHESPSPDEEPRHLGKYRIIRRFSASSGQAAAYLADDPDADRQVVLKRYKAGDSAAPGELDEARALARVRSPYVAVCLNVERVDEDLFLVVEYIPGRNLDEVRADGPLELARVVRIVSQLAEGVAAVHARGFVHRDIKPANVILHDDDTPRLVDFGLAVPLASSRLRGISGTPAFMAPEQARGDWDRIDQHADVFALGAVLYFLLTGRPPYSGTSFTEVLAAARKGVIAPPREIAPSIPVPVESVCLKALSVAPENRHSGASEFAAALLASIEPPTPLKKPLRRAILLTSALVLPLVASAVFWKRSPTAEPAGPRRSPKAPVAVTDPPKAEIEVKYYRDRVGTKIFEEHGLITEASLARDFPRPNDGLKVRVTFSRPSYFYLIALNPDGKDQLCASTPAGGPPRPGLTFPEYEKDFFGLTDGVGLQAFVAVASDVPLPSYSTWKSRLPGGLAWAPTDRDGLWTYDSSSSTEATRLRGTLRGEILHRELAPASLVGLCERLRRMPGVAAVRAVAFPVKFDKR